MVVTGVAWMGHGVGSVESSIERLFREAEREIALTVYAIYSRVDLLFDWMETALSRGIQVTVIVNRLNQQPPAPASELRRLAARYGHMRLYSFNPEEESDLHAKVVVVDRRVALIGSSNLSKRGLLTNYEMAVVISGPAAETAGAALDRLLANPYVLRVE